MTKRVLALLLMVVYCLVFLPGCTKNNRDPFVCSGSYMGEYWPTTGWRTCTPEEVGMNSEKLNKVYKYAANPNINTYGLVIVKNGYIVGEAYFQGFSSTSRFRSYSIAKSFLSSLFGIAIDQKLIESVDEKASKYLTEWTNPEHKEEKRRMTIRHLLTMSSGLEWNEEDYYGDTSRNDVFLMDKAPDYLEYALARPASLEPGTRWYYSSGDSMLLSGILERAVNKTAFQFAREHLFKPMGVERITWDCDPAGHTIGGWGIRTAIRDYAKFGYLYLKKGEWDGRQVVPRQWVEASTGPAGNGITWYGYQWWLGSAMSGFQDSIIPPGLFFAFGIYAQQMFVIPEKDIVIVRTGNDANHKNDEWREVEFLTLVLESLEG